MAFFPHASFYRPAEATTSSFTPLFRLLDDFDSYSRGCGSNTQARHGQRSGLTSFQPKFDVREVANAYELHGELPGINKENVSIEFTEPQTMVIRGKVERSYTAGTPPTSAKPQQVEEDATMSGTDTPVEPQHQRSNSNQATVEDEAESLSHESGFEEIEKPTEEQAVEKPAEKPVEKKKPVDQAKYWLTERSIGEFSRSFNFPARVDQDDVSASFKDGILSVTVPKAKKHEAVRITVN